jgi:hypothetical protein
MLHGSTNYKFILSEFLKSFNCNLKYRVINFGLALQANEKFHSSIKSTLSYKRWVLTDGSGLISTLREPNS